MPVPTIDGRLRNLRVRLAIEINCIIETNAISQEEIARLRDIIENIPDMSERELEDQARAFNLPGF